VESFGLNAVAGRAPKDFRFSGIPFEEILPGNYDGAAHLADMREDGVDASVVYPIGALSSYAKPDRELGLAIVRTYNDWLLDEFCSPDPSRLIGLPVLPAEDDMYVCLGEFERVIAKGARGCFIPGMPEVPYHDPRYEPLWAAAQDTGISLNMHRNHGGRGGAVDLGAHTDEFVAGIVHRFFSAIRPLSNMIYTGVFDRFPNLKFVAAEVNFGWIPFWIQMMEQMLEKEGHWADLHIDRRPKEYLGTNIFVTILDDYVGFDHLRSDESLAAIAMWSTDYPHSVTLWPNSQKYIADLTEGLSSKATQKVLAGNAVRVYNLPEDRGF
jgi:predicted TIM-barrel fold metal-dependent hydrolase